MKIYTSKAKLLPGTSYREITTAARYEYHQIQKHTPRRIPYIRSKYFAKNKVFLNAFWDHLKQKHPVDQERRLKFYACALDLIRNSTATPDATSLHQEPNMTFYRFYGKTDEGKEYCVQIKENKRTGRKDFISVFPKSTTK